MGNFPKQNDRMVKMGTPLESATAELKEAWRDCRCRSYASAKRLFHYTSAEGLYGIVKEKTLRLSNVSTLNDTSEMLYGSGVINEVIDGAMRRGQYSALNLKAAAKEVKEFVEKALVSHSYVFCFCLKHNLLSQWRAYGRGGAGFELGFNRRRLEAYLLYNSLRISDPMPMVYSEDRHKRAVSRFVSRADAIAKASKYNLKEDDLCKFIHEFGFLLSLFAMGMKDPSFSEEEEWRIVQVTDPDQKDVEFRHQRGIISPYLELRGIPPSVFASVTYGHLVDPTFGPELINLFLKRNQLGHVKAQSSKIPLRALL